MKRWVVTAVVPLMVVLLIGAAAWSKRDWIASEIHFRQHQAYIAQAAASSNSDQLHAFLDQPDSELRRVAAVQLARRNEPAGRAALVAALYPQTVFATGSGPFETKLMPQANVKAGQPIATIAGKSLPSPITGQLLRFYPPQPGGYQLGHRVAEIGPSEPNVREAIEALGLVGKQSDAEELESLARSFPQFAPDTTAACQKIRSRRK